MRIVPLTVAMVLYTNREQGQIYRVTYTSLTFLKRNGFRRWKLTDLDGPHVIYTRPYLKKSNIDVFYAAIASTAVTYKREYSAISHKLFGIGNRTV